MTAVTSSRAGVSPSSSPRLPSPPPIPEVQFGPKSPGVGDISKELSLDAISRPDEGATRRIRPGTKAADMAIGPPLVPLSQLDSPFQLQEHLKALYSHLTHTPGSMNTIPISKETALQLATPPPINETETVDRNLWLYELCRFLTQKANIVSIFLMNDNPPCSSATCPEMRASEWQYLCAVHEPPKSCCAIDYCNHTLDWAANVLTSPKHFPSRLALGGEAGSAIQSMRQLTNIFRRVYRIFAHAWFQHRDVFWAVEATYGLYMLFKVVCDEYHLIPEDSYTIPREAEDGQDSSEEQDVGHAPDIGQRVQILRKDDSSAVPLEDAAASSSDTSETAAGTTISTGATARRHRHTPSTGSHVATIAEGHEEDEEVTSAIVVPKHSSQPFSTAGDTAESSPREKDFPAEGKLPRLDISATVPQYEPRDPADPTPTGSHDDLDPLSAADQRPEKVGSSISSEPAQLQTPVIEEPQHDEDKEDVEEEVTSPSGGSIRTGGPDLLNAILRHTSDVNDEDGQPKNDQDNEQTEPPKHEGSESSDIKLDVQEKRDEEDGDGDTVAEKSTPVEMPDTKEDEH
ncbi:hypothetical protein A1O1_03320 [Capronia coronata CBS 617.96]|uniref:Mob1 family protein n=1 Tax=Capronia coronata CBS 617.96 TaxID=1182541 RepID=W9YLU7_9EURO|nr:uncharacterized protein A1O1_03320 [Capronia coronata CBS 617.96]EXJ90221.1 hypothetical protein A1O1_03320 [Capronia coronata CBS 617.96]